jgi:hypothetical protein|nr:MAG TPA: hyaluronidase [Caudoviricetes sp.]
MADKTFNTRISLKYDTYANWINKDPVLLAGEAAVVVVPAKSSAVQQEPAVLFKIGDGAKKFSELSFVSGLAANVYSWALAETKPSYSATEISGLADYISGEIQDTDTQYKLEVDGTNNRKFHLYSKAKGVAEWTLQDTITIPDETVHTLVEGTTNGTVKFDGADVAVHGLGSAAYVDTDAFDAAGSKDEAIAAAKSAGDNAQTAVDALSGKVGTVTEGKTVVEMIQDAQAAATYDDKDIKSRMTTAEGKITTLIGEDASKSARAIAAEEVAKIVDGADSSYDTLKEIADWISGHKTDATAMNSAIIALEGIVDGIGGDGEKATVVAYVTDAIAALKIGDYAKAADLTALAGRVDTLEGTAHEHANKAVIDGITVAKTAAWDGKAGTAAATQSAAGLMSAADKAKLDGIERGANKTTVPTALKNPKALTIQIGGTSVTYDGSTAQTVTIADGTEVSY